MASKVFVVWRTGVERYGTVVGVFSDRDKAVAYCDDVDPEDLIYYVDNYEIDALLNPIDYGAEKRDDKAREMKQAMREANEEADSETLPQPTIGAHDESKCTDGRRRVSRSGDR